VITITKILVTGSTGFVGGHLVRMLHQKGYKVRCLARPQSDTSKFRDLDVEIVQGNIFDIKTVHRITNNVDVIFHLIGGGNVSTITRRGLVRLRHLNVFSLKNILEAVKKKPIDKIIHFSSISAMGVQKNVTLTEKSPCKPKIPHEIAKRESEEMAIKYFKKYKTPVVILRPSQIYGPEDIKSEILLLVRLVKRHIFPFIGGGDFYMPLVYVTDVVNCAINAMLFGEPGETYIVSDERSYTLKEIIKEIANNIPVKYPGFYVPTKMAKLLIFPVEKLCKYVGVEPPFTIYRIDSITSNRFVSINKAKEKLFYKPIVNLQTGMQRTITWYKSKGFL